MPIAEFFMNAIYRNVNIKTGECYDTLKSKLFLYLNFSYLKIITNKIYIIFEFK